jgi:ParB-like chromosome segregation protein Spo0J
LDDIRADPRTPARGVRIAGGAQTARRPGHTTATLPVALLLPTLPARTDGPLPPILVDRRSMRVIAGRHRLLAAVLMGHETVDVEFFDASRADAFLRAVRADAAHGFLSTPADRQEAAARIVRSHPQLSDRAIAEIAGLGAKAVAAIRHRAGDEPPGAGARVGRDGKTRPLDAREGRRRAAELLAESPHASIRQVAREAGVSPATVSDVRKRLERGDLPTTDRPRKTASADRVASAVPGSVLEELSRDPALRRTEAGRSVLGLLYCANESLRWPESVAGIPAHCAGMIGQLAQQYTQIWSQIADEMAQFAARDK